MKKESYRSMVITSRIIKKEENIVIIFQNIFLRTVGLVGVGH